MRTKKGRYRAMKSFPLAFLHFLAFFSPFFARVLQSCVLFCSDVEAGRHHHPQPEEEEEEEALVVISCGRLGKFSEGGRPPMVG